MKLFKALAAAALIAAAPLSANAAMSLSLCVDTNGADGFQAAGPNTTCYTDGGTGFINVSPVPGLTAFASTGTGEPGYLGGFGLDFANAGGLLGNYIFAVAQTGLEFPGVVPSQVGVTTAFSSLISGPGTSQIQVFVDDANRGLSTIAGAPLFTGGPYAGNTLNNFSGSTTLADPFSILAFVQLIGGEGGSTFSTDLQVKIPEPGTIALLGLGLMGLALARRRRSE